MVTHLRRRDTAIALTITKGFSGCRTLPSGGTLGKGNIGVEGLLFYTQRIFLRHKIMLAPLTEAGDIITHPLFLIASWWMAQRLSRILSGGHMSFMSTPASSANLTTSCWRYCKPIRKPSASFPSGVRAMVPRVRCSLRYPGLKTKLVLPLYNEVVDKC